MTFDLQKAQSLSEIPACRGAEVLALLIDVNPIQEPEPPNLLAVGRYKAQKESTTAASNGGGQLWLARGCATHYGEEGVPLSKRCQMDENINVFISYAHEDTIIANAIKDQLTLLAQSGKGGPSLNCFLDTESIQPGVKYEPVIRAALDQADWLIVVFTGYQSVYCGYEIGMYSIIKPQPDKSIDEKPVACLHDVEKRKLPAVVEGYNTTLISRIAPYLPDPPNMLTPNADLWWNSPVGRLLRAICATKDLYTPQHRKNNPVQYQIDIAQAASKIAYSFEIARQEDEQSETPLQAGLELIVFPPFEGKEGERIPPQSTVLGASRAFEILGLNVPYSVGGCAQETAAG